MFLSRIRLENVRGFYGNGGGTDLSIPAEPGWYVFAGRNGSGKSTLLRAIALALAGPDFARQLVPSFARWIRQGASVASVGVDFMYDAELDRFVGMGKLPKKNGLSVELTWTRAEGGPEPELTFHPVRQTKLAGAWRGPWSENPTGWLVVGYGPFRRLTGHAAEAVRAMLGPHHMRRLASLFYEDASLKEVVEWLKNEKLRSYQKRAEATELLRNVIDFLNDGLLPDGARVVDVDDKGLWVERAGARVELQELSDGYRVALALVLDLVRHMQDAYGEVEFDRAGERVHVAMPAIVLIDEIDAHLHLSWQQRIGFWLQERFPRVQFFVTTHSPFVCQAASDNGLFRLPEQDEARGIELVDETTFMRVVNGTINSAVLSKLFGLDHSESPKAQGLRREWSELEAKRIRQKLNPAESKRYDSLRKQLPLAFEGDAAE